MNSHSLSVSLSLHQSFLSDCELKTNAFLTAAITASNQGFAYNGDEENPVELNRISSNVVLVSG